MTDMSSSMSQCSTLTGDEDCSSKVAHRNNQVQAKTHTDPLLIKTDDKLTMDTRGTKER